MSIGWTSVHSPSTSPLPGEAGARAVVTAGPKRVVLIGATGMVGGYALRYLLADEAVGELTAIVRRTLGVSHPKLREIIHADFADYSALGQVLAAQDAAVFCLGTYTGVVSDAELRRVTVDCTVAFARSLSGGSPGATLSFLSGSGADQTGRSRIAFARYKGEAEAALLAAGFPRVCLFRPAYIYPVEPRREPTITYRVMRFIYPVFRLLFPDQVIRADDLARVMVDAAVRGTSGRPGPIFENRDIRALAAAVRPASG